MLSNQKIKIMVVDDSVAVRGLLRQIIEGEDDMEVITTAIDGKMGVLQYKNHQPDIVLMDIEMPNMNGLESMTEILKMDPSARIIMCSSLTQKGADLTIKALNLGAFECLAKPTTTSIDRGDGFKEQLIQLLRNTNQYPKKSQNIENLKAASEEIKDFKLESFDLKPIPTSFFGSNPQVLAIGSSTGGPQTLAEVLSRLDLKINIPVFITQHMPEGFTKILAENLSRRTSHNVIEAEDEMPVKNGTIYIAPGGKHMTVQKRTAGTYIALTDGPAVQYCKPSVNVMMDSILKTYRSGIITAILTGMGEDGLELCQKIVNASERNILVAQDETTSIVWGMPAAVARAGICHAVIPVSNIAPALNKLMNGQRP